MIRLPKTKKLDDNIVNRLYASNPDKKRKYLLELIHDDDGKIKSITEPNSEYGINSFYEHPEIKGLYGSVPNAEIISMRSGEARFVGSINNDKGQGYKRVYYRDKDGKKTYIYSHIFMADLFFGGDRNIVHHIKKDRKNPNIIYLENAKNRSLHRRIHDDIKRLWYLKNDRWIELSIPNLYFLACLLHTGIDYVYDIFESQKEKLNDEENRYIVRGKVETYDKGQQEAVLKVETWD